jgi:hypothetical protein
MSRFKYVGEKPRKGFVKSMGRLKKIRIPLKDGTVAEFLPKNGEFFPPGQDIGYDIADEYAVKLMSVDSRYMKIQ